MNPSQERGWVYLMSAPEAKRLKIGFSSDPEVRLREVRTSSSSPVLLVAQKSGTPADERALHTRFRKFWHYGEWFDDVPEIREAFETPFPSIVSPSNSRPSAEMNNGGADLHTEAIRRIGLQLKQKEFTSDVRGRSAEGGRVLANIFLGVD